MMQEILNPFAPVFDEHSRVLILGTMPSPKSREKGFYYGHPQNRFWRVLSAVLDEPLPESDVQKREFVLKRGIALYDVLRSCAISGASDASIRRPVANDLSPILERAEIRAIFATGQKAAVLYRAHCEKKTGREIVALPSPSPANCAFSMEQLIRAYQVIVDFLR